jgi:hypothetical protein
VDNVGGTLTVLNNAVVNGNAPLDRVMSRLRGGGIERAGEIAAALFGHYG